MAFWTQAKLDELDEAIYTLGIGAISSVTVAGQQVTSADLDKLRALRAEVAAGLAGSNASGGGGLRSRQLVPPGCG